MLGVVRGGTQAGLENSEGLTKLGLSRRQQADPKISKW